MVDRYWREIEDVENDIENAMQISSILLKLKGYDDDLGKIDTNENNISSNLTKINDNENSISNNLGKIDNISEFILKSDKDFEKKYNIEPQIFKFNTNNHFFSIFEKEIEHDFIKNSLLFVKNNIYYKYDNLSNDYYRCQHEYNIYDDENNLIHKYLFNKDTYYDVNSNILNTTEEFCVYFKKNYRKIKIVLELHRHNRHGFGNINLEIDNNNNCIKLDYIEKGFLDNSHLINLNTGSISTNSGKIDKNTSDISDNKGLIETNTSTISDIEQGVELLIEPYNETHMLSNRTITTNRQILFEKIINFDFSGLGVFNIVTTCNYDKYNFTHEYQFLNNDELIFKKSINVTSNVVKDEFKFKSIDTSSLKIMLYLTDNDTNEKISLFGKNSLQFKYSKIKFKSDINENNIKSNLEKINDNSGLIDTNTRNISFNKGLITNIKNNSTIIHNDVYNETFILSNRNIAIETQLIFKKIINFDFNNNGFYNIITTCNYDYDTTYNYNHKYRFFDNDNGELLKEEIIPNNIESNVVKDTFQFEGIGDVSSLKIELYITDNIDEKLIKLLSNSSLQFKCSKIDFKTDINEGKINTNTGSISTNSGLINTNTLNISSNLEKITALQTSNIKAFYNLDQIFIYDIEHGYQTVDKDNHFHIFEKEITYNFTKNSYLEIALKVLTEVSNYILIGYFQILCNFYDQDNHLFYTISLSTAMGSINKLSTVKSVFIAPINENMSKIKIDFFIAPKETQQNRSAKFTIKDINSNKIYVKYFQKTEEMSIKDIKDSLNSVNNMSDRVGELENKLYLKNLFNELYYDSDIKVSHIFYDKTFLINAKRNDFIEVYIKMLLKYGDISNAKYVDTNFILYDMSNGRELFSKSYNNEDYIGITNADIILNNAFHFNFDNDVTKLKIAITFSWTRNNLDITYKSVNANRLIVKHYGN